MEELRRYSSVEELKENSQPSDQTSTRSEERHARFESFMNFLKDDKDTVSSWNSTSMSGNSVYAL
ncbi:hypothetical protein GCM10028805_58180 [Spirosoma harenae]